MIMDCKQGKIATQNQCKNDAVSGVSWEDKVSVN